MSYLVPLIDSRISAVLPRSMTLEIIEYTLSIEQVNGLMPQMKPLEMAILIQAFNDFERSIYGYLVLRNLPEQEIYLRNERARDKKIEEMKTKKTNG
ncbi:MAG: hypothetical protein EON54_03430 [Alcaligenaceae bacterium]|nr:MAG: hypothetical protein EON54_03430 [Alcaligenaceae bacterium]